MAANKIDTRQITYKGTLSQLSSLSVTELDNLLKAIGDELIPPLRLSASSTPDLIVSVGAALITNSETNRSHSISHVGALLPNSFTSGTVTFPATSGGTITVSPGNNGTLTVSSGNYIKVLIYMDATGALNVLPGVENAVEASASVLAPPKKTLPIGYVTLQNIAGTIQNVQQSKIVQFATGGGGSGSGSGSGLGSDLSSLTMLAEFFDAFEDIPSSADSAVDITSGYTDSTTYSAANAYYRLAYDASKTVTGTGTAMTLSGTPSFTIKIGDILRVGTEARRITAVGTQTTPTIESAFTVDPSASACTVSQAVYTKDLNNIVVDGNAISDALPGNINQVLISYEDTEAADDVIFNVNTTPVIAYTVSSDNTSFTEVKTRATDISDEESIVDLPTSDTSLIVRFFSNKSSGSGFINLLGYHTYFHRDQSYQDGSILNQAYCMTNGTGTEINCFAPSVVSGKTRVQLDGWSFPVGVNSGETNGSIKVYINGQKIPRFIDSTLTPDASYIEIDAQTIELDSDYSSFAYSIEIIQDVAVVDNIDTNSTSINQLQEINKEGFQGFINDSTKMVATTTPGTPVAGTFYSTITGRKPIADLSSNLKAQMGIERIQIQHFYRLQDEFGPNGEATYGVVNDTNNQIRLVGNWTGSLPEIYGYRAVANTTLGAYAEITFYGTGLNYLTDYNINTNDIRYSVDGGSEVALPLVAQATTLSTLKYSANTIIPVVSGLSLGVHTIRLRWNAGSWFVLHGIEILNESSTIKLNPGSSYINGKKLTLNSQQSLAYNSSFESGTLGTRGGRVLVYQKADGTIAKAVTPTNSTQQNTTSADHTNEEIARTYSFREFAASRSDDFSAITGSATNKSFTLDDGTTTLSGSGVVYGSSSGTAEYFGPNTTSDNFIFTFVGTGLDIVNTFIGAISVNCTIDIDGVSIFTGNVSSLIPSSGFAGRIKIVSGLPYGTHTFRFNKTGAGSGFGVNQFIVYQPKTPTLPAGSVELAAYNVMADYSSGIISGNISALSTGVLHKQSTREMVYVGAWSATFASPNVLGGSYVTSATSGNYVEYSFFGTGINIIGSGGTTTVQIDGANYTGAATAVGTSSSWTPGTSTWVGASVNGAGLIITGLSLGLHKVRVTLSASVNFFLHGIHILTPIHSPKSNFYAELQSTLSVGSCAISDNRKTSAIKELLPSKKAWGQAIGVTSGPTTTSTSFIPCPDMSLTVTTSGGDLKISYSIGASINPGGGGSPQFQIYLNGVAVSSIKAFSVPTTDNAWIAADSHRVPVPSGTHKIDVYWRTSGGTMTGTQTWRSVLAEEQ